MWWLINAILLIIIGLLSLVLYIRNNGIVVKRYQYLILIVMPMLGYFTVLGLVLLVEDLVVHWRGQNTVLSWKRQPTVS